MIFGRKAVTISEYLSVRLVHLLALAWLIKLSKELTPLPKESLDDASLY